MSIRLFYKRTNRSSCESHIDNFTEISQIKINKAEKIMISSYKNNNQLPTDMIFILSWVFIPFLMMMGFEYAFWARSQPWPAGLFSFSLLMLGAVLLFISRLPLYRQGNFMSIGIRYLPKSSLVWYRLAYWFIIPNIFILLLMWLTLQTVANLFYRFFEEHKENCAKHAFGFQNV